MTYVKLLAKRWFKSRLSEGLLLIPIAFVLALIALFFTKVVLELAVPFIVLWRWCWIIGMAVSLLLSIIWLFNRWRIDHHLAKHWDVEPEKVFHAIVVLKIFKEDNLTVEDIKEVSKERFLMKYNISEMMQGVKF